MKAAHLVSTPGVRTQLFTKIQKLNPNWLKLKRKSTGSFDKKILVVFLA